MRALLIDDQEGMGRIIPAALTEQGIETEWLTSESHDLVETICTNQPQAVILSIPMKGHNPETLSRALRAKNYNGAIVVLRETRDPDEAVALYAAGIDDLTPKPVNSRHLSARLRAIVRRMNGQASSEVQIGELTFAFDGRLPKIAGQTLKLAPQERQLLECLVLKAGKMVSRDTIYHTLYGAYGTNVDSKIIEVYICKLRRKIDAASNSKGSYITTIFGSGYMLAAPEKELTSHAA